MAYYNATICLNGHVVNKYQADSQKHCSQCGEETFSFCPHCKSPVRGIEKYEGVVIGNKAYIKPSYCYECGTPYPWTQKILNNAIDLLSIDDDIDDSSKELIKSAIPELLVDVPTTPIAVAKYKKGISNASQLVKDTMRQLLIDVISETVKKTLFP